MTIAFLYKIELLRNDENNQNENVNQNEKRRDERETKTMTKYEKICWNRDERNQIK